MVLPLLAVLVGFPLAVLASRRVVNHASAIAAGSRIPRFVIGVSLLAIGTDLPEIANSVIASLAGEGDVNVGDSLGSTATQVTLVLGSIPFLAGPFMVKRGGGTVRTALITVVALLVGMLLMVDGFLGRMDAVVLVSMGIGGSIYLWRKVPPEGQLELELSERPRIYHVAMMFLTLVFVVLGAAIAVWGVVEIAEVMGIPGFIISFFGASIGTSLPELAVGIAAVRRGEADLAIGDAVGSSFFDATLSLGSGPLIAPTAITAAFAVEGATLAAIAVAVVAILFSRVRRHDRRTGALLLLVYAGFYVSLL